MIVVEQVRVVEHRDGDWEAIRALAATYYITLSDDAIKSIEGGEAFVAPLYGAGYLRIKSVSDTGS